MAALEKPKMPILRETPEQIYQRMVNRLHALAEKRGELPPATDEGEIFYDLEYPIAEEKSDQQQLLEYFFLQGFPVIWSDGEYLDAHAAWLGLSRKPDESDEAFRDRLLAKAGEEEGNGAEYDYIRWVKEVSGVGEVFVWGEAPNTVHIAITDTNDMPAPQELVSVVQTYLEQPNKHHMNDKVIVTPSPVVNLSVTGEITEVATGTTFEQVKPVIESSIRTYVKKQRDKILYSEVYRLFKVAGVIDYKNVKINGSTANVSLTFAAVPVLTSLEVTQA